MSSCHRSREGTGVQGPARAGQPVGVLFCASRRSASAQQDGESPHRSFTPAGAPRGTRSRTAEHRINPSTAPSQVRRRRGGQAEGGKLDDHRHSGAGQAADAEQALTLAAAFGPDVITLDTALPDGQVWTLGRTLREADAHVGIVIITDDPGDDTLFRALDCGASALVHKSAPIREILSAVRHAAGSPASFTASGPSVALRRRRETPERAVLSPREQQILLLLHDGLSVPQVAAELFVSLSTAKTCIARLYDKLDARNRAQALMAAVRLGLLDEHAATRHGTFG